MKQEISALMDGEMFEDEAEVLLEQVRRDSGARRDWEMYHLIGDVLRQPEHIHADLSAGVRERMRDEPVVLAPRIRPTRQKARSYALSAAASLVAIGVVSWMSLQIGPEKVRPTALQQASLRSVEPRQIKPKANDYLMAHQEFSPSADMSGGASYVRTVSYSPEGK